MSTTAIVAPEPVEAFQASCAWTWSRPHCWFARGSVVEAAVAAGVANAVNPATVAMRARKRMGCSRVRRNLQAVNDSLTTRVASCHRSNTECAAQRNAVAPNSALHCAEQST